MFFCKYCTTFQNIFIEHLLGLLLYFGQLNFNHSLENLRTMDDINFTNFHSDRVIGGNSYCCASYWCFLEFIFAKLPLCIAPSPEGPSYCCFRKAVLSNFFQKVLLTNFISTYANLLHFISFSTDRSL